MVNDFYASLMNRQFLGGVPGTDYVPSTWRPRAVSSEASQVHRCLMVEPENQAACNWRIAEIRKVIEKSDLLSTLIDFDPRTGYLLDELITDMSRYFRPAYMGTQAVKDVSINGRFKGRAYRIKSWQVRIDTTPGTWRVTSEGESDDGQLSGDGQQTVRLIGADARVTFNTQADAEYTLLWAAKPTVSLAESAKELRQGLQPSLYSLANATSVLGQESRESLKNAASRYGEAAGQVAAAAILYAGHALASPEID